MRPPCWAEASRSTPTSVPGLSRSWSAVRRWWRLPRGGCGGTHEDPPHRGRLAGAVRAEEAGHAAGGGAEADVVDGGEVTVGLGDRLDADHVLGSPRTWGWGGDRGRGQVVAGSRRPATARGRGTSLQQPVQGRLVGDGAPEQGRAIRQAVRPMPSNQGSTAGSRRPWMRIRYPGSGRSGGGVGFVHDADARNRRGERGSPQVVIVVVSSRPGGAGAQSRSSSLARRTAARRLDTPSFM